MEMKAAAPRCQLLLILLMSVVMLLPGTNGSLLLVQRIVTRTIVLQETIGKAITCKQLRSSSTEEWIMKTWYINSVLLSCKNNNDLMKFAGKWIKLEKNPSEWVTWTQNEI
ncbi:hypothetical protein STEG23_026475, partial [Scotinomys teguina]